MSLKDLTQFTGKTILFDIVFLSTLIKFIKTQSYALFTFLYLAVLNHSAMPCSTPVGE